jgi:hypothetical protein
MLGIRITVEVSPRWKYWGSRILAAVLTVAAFLGTLYLMHITDIP